jgi:hypothetical protein
MFALGWSRLGKNSKYKGWCRGRGDEREMLCYVEYKGEDSLAYMWGFDLARKKLPFSFVMQIADDHGGGFFGQVLLAGYASFSRPLRIRETVE